MARGYYLMYRGWMNDPLFKDEPFCERLAWEWLIHEASFEPHKIRSGKNLIEVQRGQVPTSYRKLVDKWGWSLNRIRNFLEILKKDGKIQTSTDTGFIVITICNYDKFQFTLRKSDTASDTSTDTPTDTHADTNINKYKEINNLDDVYNAPTHEEDMLGEVSSTEGRVEKIREIFGWIEKRMNSAIPLHMAPLIAWMEWGADVELDIKPVVDRYMVKYPGAPPRSLSWLDEDIAKSIKQRQKTMPIIEVSNEKNERNQRITNSGRDGYGGEKRETSINLFARVAYEVGNKRAGDRLGGDGKGG